MGLFFKNLPVDLAKGLKTCRPHFMSAWLFSALVNLLYLAPTLYMMQVYDRVVPTGGVMTLFWLTVIIAIAVGTLTALDGVRSRMMMRASLRLHYSLGQTIFDRLFARRKGEAGKPVALQAMREFDTIRTTMTGPAMMAAFDVPWTPIYLIASFMVHPLLALIIVIGGVILTGLAIANERSSRVRAQVGMKANSAAYAAQDSLFSNAELIRSLGMRNALVSRHMIAREEGVIATTQAQLASTRYTGLVKFVRMFLQSLSLGAGAYLAINGQISSGTIIAASVLLSRALQPIEQLVGSWSGIVQARSALESLSALFDETEHGDAPKMALPDPVGHIALTNVTLRNPQGTAFLLKGINLTLKPGEITGLIGPSGGGKSTLSRVIAGGLEPDAGEIRIDSANYADWDQDQLGKHIGYMPQDNALLSGSIAENIARFSINQGEDVDAIALKIVDAAQLAGVHELILSLPGGYQAAIGDPSFRLSGGQIQRIALARALFGRPKVLILDEPNSALDAEGEQALVAAIQTMKLNGSAILLVAHRSLALSHADRLVIMNGGAIEHEGPRQQVIEDMREAASRRNVVNMARS
jgi:PrtD family type I secretion system ABC transporter